MFTGVHAIIYSQDADADRAFIRDVLGFPGVDAGHGWLIFKLPPAEIAVHPTEAEPQHEVYLMCEDLPATLKRLSDQGIEVGEPADRGWGVLSSITLPSGAQLPVYEPRHPTAHLL